MKAISLWQPYASLIAAGLKPFETRHWAPPIALIGQTIAIHAAKKVDRDLIPFVEDIVYGQHRDLGHHGADKLQATFSKATKNLARFGNAVLPVGCVVATARLNDALHLGKTHRRDGKLISEILATKSPVFTTADYLIHDDFGDYSEGRWVWHLTDITPLNPPPRVKGAQGFFDLPQGWMVEP